MAECVIKDLNSLSDNVRAENSQRFFKTGPGQYGAGDKFIGVTMPQLRSVCKKYLNLSNTNTDLQTLLNSAVHEHRMAAVVIMSSTFKKLDETKQKQLFELYLKNVESGRINNWDIVDVSAKYVVGEYLLGRSKSVLYTLAKNKNLWSRRVAILSTPAFFAVGDATHTIKLAEILLHDKHDLMHKAVGWMLREVGKCVDIKLLTNFLDIHAHEMPRTTLRYAIERLSPAQQKHYMQAKMLK
jgi:3-methyladenine DNA glycosylase AlkD